MSKALSKAGAIVKALLDQKQDLGHKTATEIHSTTGTPVQFHNLDLRDTNAATNAISKISHNLGCPDILINCASIVDSKLKAEDYDAQSFCALIDTNLTGAFLVAQACARHMIGRARGDSIILVSFITNFHVLRSQEQYAYNTSKANVIHLSKSLATE